MHYTLNEVSDGRQLRLAPQRVKEAMQSFSAFGVDVVVCLGDFVDLGVNHDAEKSCWATLTEEIISYNLPFYILPGNHDYEVAKGADFSNLSTMPEYPFKVEIKGYNLIFLDACYKKNGLRYDVGGMVWNDCSLPKEQIDFLKRTLEKSDKPCVVFTHQDLVDAIDPDYLIAEHKEIRNIIECSNKVKWVFSGHYHQGAERIINGVHYVTMPSMTATDKNEYRIFDV